VGDAGLGTINAVLLSAGVLAGLPLVVALNRFGDDPLHAANRDHLAGAGLDVVTVPGALVDRLAGGVP
jgi:hypothetical protein